MQSKATVAFAVAALFFLIPASGLAITPYAQDFEALVQTDVDALGNEGWLVFGNVSTPTGEYIYGYGPFPAPNDGAAFCAIATGQGGDDQGAQQLNVYSDYENTDHGAGNIVESNVFREQVVDAASVGETWVFDFNAKMGNIEGASTAAAFIKTLDPNAGYAMTNFITADMTAIPVTWGGYSVSIEITADLVDQILQFGFMNTATDYVGSGIYYDNVDFHLFDPTDVPDASVIAGAQLGQNYPNPFNPGTRIDFSLEKPGFVEIGVYDLAGRRIATLHRGNLDAGEHDVFWNGRSDGGVPAAAGQYSYVLKTATGQVSRSMVLLK